MSDITNVIVVVIDALRADRVGVLGNDRKLTPSLDAIAESGTTFENAYTCAPNTDPSITSLLTGRYPLNTVLHHGSLVSDEEKQRIESVPSVPMLLSQEGWETASLGQALGRWHKRGFDHYPEIDGDTDGTVGMARKLHRLFVSFDTAYPRLGSVFGPVYDALTLGSWTRNRMKPRIVEEDYDPTEILSIVDSEPFFGFVHLMETHMPYLGRTGDFEELWERHTYPRESLEEFFEDRDVTQAQYDRVANSLRYLGLDRPGELLALYDAAVRYADDKLGMLVKALKRSEQWENTALFVLGDHGESLLDHGIFIDHHGLYEEVFRVPLVCNRSIGSGTRVSEFVQLMDVAPTILDIADIEQPGNVDGRSLVPLMEGAEEWEDRKAVYAEEAYTERRRAVRTRRWKYLGHVPDEVIEEERGSSIECGYCNTVHGSEEVLFDLSSDAGEHENVIDDYPDVVRDLREKYETFVDGLVASDDSPVNVRYEHEEEVLERLRAIGYK